MRFASKILICQTCNEEFIYTADAQQWNAERGYTDNPKQCKHCHQEMLKQKTAEEIEDMLNQESHRQRQRDD